MTRKQNNQLVMSINKRSSLKFKKLKDLELPASASTSSMKDNEMQIVDSANDQEQGSTSLRFNHHSDEEMDDVDWEDGSTHFGDTSCEITIEVDDSIPNSNQKKVVRRATSEEKEVAEIVHKVHLLCLLARGRIIDRACDDPLIQASLISLIPAFMLKKSNASELVSSDLFLLARWVNTNFRVDDSYKKGKSFRSFLRAAIEHRQGSSEEIAALFVALSRALGFTTRFVSILDVASIKPTAESFSPSTHNSKRVRRNIFENETVMVNTTTDLPKNQDTESEIPKEECSTSSSRKRKSDLEFEMQLQMAISATAAATPPQNVPNVVKRLTKSSPQAMSTAFGCKKSGSPLYWAEVFCNGECDSGKWVHVDPVHATVNEEDKVDVAVSSCKKLLRYAVAFAGNGAKDVTRRYCVKWGKIGAQRVSPKWWDSVLSPLRELESGSTDDSRYRSSIEDMELETRASTEPLPTNQQAYRSHHLYALERWLLKTQMLRPRGPILGLCSGHPVYPRSCVQTLKTKHKWLREGLQVKANQSPAKVLKQSRRQKNVEHSEVDEDDSDSNVELFGRWQLEPLVLPHAVNGIVPKNERGQVDVWSEKCLPPGTVHIRLPKAFVIAKKLQIDYAPAMVGFEFRNGKSVPVYDGIVVCSEFRDIVLEAFAEEEERRQAEERKRNEAQALARWYQLLSSVITRHRLRNTYADNPPRVDVSTGTGSDAVEARDTRANAYREEHEHVFPAEDQTYDAESSVRTKRCRCGFSVQVEEL